MVLVRPKSRSHSLAYATLAVLIVISTIQWVRNSAVSVEYILHGETFVKGPFDLDGVSLKRPLVWYAAFKKHIGFYPRSSAIAAFKTELAAYKTSKGAIQFPLDKPIPAGLVKKIVKFRLNENASKS